MDRGVELQVTPGCRPNGWASEAGRHHRDAYGATGATRGGQGDATSTIRVPPYHYGTPHDSRITGHGMHGWGCATGSATNLVYPATSVCLRY